MRPVTTVHYSYRHASDSAASARNAALAIRSVCVETSRRNFSSLDKRQIKTPAEASSEAVEPERDEADAVRQDTGSHRHRGLQRHPRDRQPFQPKGRLKQSLPLAISPYQVIVSLPSRIS
jgi:hypothetical protein